MSFDYQSFQMLRDGLDEGVMICYAAYGIIDVVSETRGFISGRTALLSEDYYQLLFPVEQRNQPMIGRTLIAERALKVIVNDIELEGNGNVRINGAPFHCHPMDSRATDRIILDGGVVDTDLSLSESIILPLTESSWDILTKKPLLHGDLLRVVYPAAYSADEVEHLKQLIVDQLSQANAQAVPSFEDELALLSGRIADLRSDVDLATWVAFIALIIVTIGVSGMMIILMNRRRREFAIMQCLGAGPLTPTWEAFLEVGIVLVLGCIASCVISVPLCGTLSTALYHVKFHAWTVVPLLIISLCIDISACFVSTHMSPKANLSTTLKST